MMRKKDFQGRTVNMTSTVENLAAKIAALEEHEQQTLWGRVVELNFHRGLYHLSEQYRERLQRQRELGRSVEEVLAELRLIREEIAAHDYPG
jgi:hypothetical protein